MGASINQNLDFLQLSSLLHSVFGLKEKEKGLVLVVDLPDSKKEDSAEWSDRRSIAAEWYITLAEGMENLPFEAITLCMYPNVHTNNNDLPPDIMIVADTADRSTAGTGRTSALRDVLAKTSIILAPTELSATAPLKNLAKQFGFRGATLPGFTRKMIPALMLDYAKVNQRVMDFKSRLDLAAGAAIMFQTGLKEYTFNLDLRYRVAHASGGLIRENCTVANLPSGEAYIVPYEGERPGEPSRTSGLLPVQFGDEIVVYSVRDNRAVDVLSAGSASDEERTKLRDEPAYGNIAELGLGVLGEWGVAAAGSILIDEKLGLHIAFGRSEHFGGITGPASFRDRANIMHIDRVYVPSMQPLIVVNEVTLSYADGQRESIMKAGKYIV